MARSSSVLAAAFALGLAAAAHAQFPEKPLKLIVPQAAGSATDNIARLLAAEMARPLGQPVVVENRPGGALTIGIDAVAKSAPDGYTLGMGPVGALAITRHKPASPATRRPPGVASSRPRDCRGRFSSD